jgi:NAD(P)H-dependent FMN reductase
LIESSSHHSYSAQERLRQLGIAAHLNQIRRFAVLISFRKQSPGGIRAQHHLGIIEICITIE